MMKKLLILGLIAFSLPYIISAQNDQNGTVPEYFKRTADSVIAAEKALLKEEITRIDQRLLNGEISKDEAVKLKNEAAERTAKIIEEKIRMIRPTATKDTLVVIEMPPLPNPHSEKICLPKRTYGGPTLALGFHSLDSENGFGDDRFKTWGSKSFEIGYYRNFRILKNHNLLHLNYGLSVMMNKLKMANDDYFVNENNITNLKPFGQEIIKSKFKNTYLTLPVNFELDFSSSCEKNGYKYHPIHDSFRVGIGAFLGVLLESKQVVKYRENGKKIRNVDRGNFNVNPWIYGLSAHIGYGEAVFYFKYHLTPLFGKNNLIEEHPFSVGIRIGG